VTRARRHRAAALAAALLVAGPAAAIDLTGTWQLKTETLKCRISGPVQIFTEHDANWAELAIRDEGDELWIAVHPGGDGYENKYFGLVFTHPKSDAKGYGVATACTLPGKYYAGTIRIPKAKADAEGGTLTFEYTGTRFTTIATCKGQFERTSAAAPAITLTCP
jgi:hypothetical protein